MLLLFGGKVRLRNHSDFPEIPRVYICEFNKKKKKTAH